MNKDEKIKNIIFEFYNYLWCVLNLNKLIQKYCKHNWVLNSTIPTFDIGDEFTPNNPTKFDNIYFCKKCRKIKRERINKDRK